MSSDYARNYSFVKRNGKQSPNVLQIDSGRILWVSSNSIPIFIYNNLEFDFNYRILVGNTSTIIMGTPCENLKSQLSCAKLFMENVFASKVLEIKVRKHLNFEWILSLITFSRCFCYIQNVLSHHDTFPWVPLVNETEM